MSVEDFDVARAADTVILARLRRIHALASAEPASTRLAPVWRRVPPPADHFSVEGWTSTGGEGRAWDCALALSRFWLE